MWGTRQAASATGSTGHARINNAALLDARNPALLREIAGSEANERVVLAPPVSVSTSPLSTAVVRVSADSRRDTGLLSVLRPLTTAVRLSSHHRLFRVGALAIILTIAWYTCARLRRSQRRRELKALMATCLADTSVCHLFVKPPCALGPSATARCVEALLLMRISLIPCKTHYIADTYAADDIAYALESLPEIKLMQSKDAADASSRELPVVIHSASRSAFVGCQAIELMCLSKYRDRLSHMALRNTAGVAKALCEKLAFSLGVYVGTTLRDHADIAAYMITRKYHLASTLLGGMRLRLCGDDLVQLRDVNGDPSAIALMDREEYERDFMRDLSAFEHTLGAKPFVLGDRPSAYDCAIYAALLPVFAANADAQVATMNRAICHALESNAIRQYMGRLTRLAFPDGTTFTINNCHDAVPEIALGRGVSIPTIPLPSTAGL